MLKKDLIKIFQKGKDFITTAGYIQHTDEALSDEEFQILEENMNEFWIFYEKALKKDIELGYINNN
tara:strand:- start:315 stop:512 length:198 start_codon:yes stop_codon:yes gene_type:complete